MINVGVQRMINVGVQRMINVGVQSMVFLAHCWEINLVKDIV